MRLGHWDAQFGISGDMALGSLLGAGARLEAVNDALGRLGVPGLRVHAGTAVRSGLACVRVEIRWGHRPDDHHHDHDGHGHRPYAAISGILARSGLAPGVRERAEAVFARLGEAEAAIHGVPLDEVAFHEVGGEDALGDIVGSCAALEDLGIGHLTVSSLPSGGGMINVAHGLLPVPAPAVARMLGGRLVHPGPADAELVTPTGAALVAALTAPSDGRWPAMVVGGDGWGAGSRDFLGHPNATRFVWGTATGQAGGGDGLMHEQLLEVEANIDDQSPQLIGYLQERLTAAGALDVTITPVWMKKQRPGVAVWALTGSGQAQAVIDCVLAESSTIGLRVTTVERRSLPRVVLSVQTPYGEVAIKVAHRGGRVVNVSAEYENCKTVATEHGVPLKAVVAAALAGAPAVGDPVPRA